MVTLMKNINATLIVVAAFLAPYLGSGQTCPLPSPPTLPTNPACLTGGGACMLPFLPPGGPTTTNGTPIAKSADPNGKITTGYGNQGYIPPDATITYTIYFENQSSATAPAAEVVVTDPLDPNLDPSTVQFSQMGFNNVTLNLPGGLQSYSTQASVSTSPYPVTVSASMNPSTGTLTWTMQSIDPTTGAPPADPLAGFLPPDNSSQRGEGFVTFTVKPKSGLVNGTAINNTASIVFDRNATINTNTVTNTIDSVYPSSSVDPLPAITYAVSFPVSWSGTDPAGAGIATYDIYSSTDSGPYSAWQSATAATSATFNGALGHTYSFYSIATDNVGHRQQSPGPAQSTATQAAPTVSSFILTPTTLTSGATVTLAVQLTAAAPSGGTVVSLSSSNASVVPVPTSLTISAGQSSASLPIQVGSVTSPTMVTVTGTLNGASQQAQVTVNPTPNFTLSASPASLSVAQGGTGTSTITVTDVGGFSGTVTLAASGLPSGVSASFAAGSTAGTQVLTVTANTSAAITSSPVTVPITGTSGSLTTIASVSLTITPEPSFTAGSGGTTSLTVTPGATTGNTGTISVVGTNGFSGTVNLTCSISPVAASDPPTCSLSPSSVTITGTAAQNSMLTVTTTAASSAENRLKKLLWPSAGGAALALVLLIGVPRRRRKWLTMLGVLALFLCFSATSCGGGGSGGGGGGGGGNTGTTPGTYTVTVTGTSGSITGAVGMVTLTVE